jgi:hypothetical protein
MAENLDKNILSTVCYYDALGYPMTVFEIWKYLIETRSDKEGKDDSIGLEYIISRLDKDSLKRFISQKRGFYFIKGKDFLVNQRIKRDKISNQKIRKIRKITYLLRFLPFIRAIIVTGRLAMKNARGSSDWDVLIVLEKDRIWTGRTIITFFTHLLGKRRHGNKTKDRICLNYFVTTDSLEIKNKDLFSANEYFFCVPIFSTKKYFEKFQIRNKWIKKYKPNYFLSNVKNLKEVKDTKISEFLRSVLETIFSWNILESYLEKIEKKKINKNPKTRKEEGLIGGIIFQLLDS